MLLAESNCTGVYDVTNTYFYGKKCPLAKCGKDKEGVKGRPLIQIGLGVTKQKGVPVVHSKLPFGYDHKYTYSHIGYNFRITDMQAAIGAAQMD